VLRDPAYAAETSPKGPAPTGTVAGNASKNKPANAQIDVLHTGVPEALRAAINAAIRTNLSARHVPDGIFAIPEVPRTLSGKKLEIPVKKILLGHDVKKAVNRDSMSNPASIDWFIDFGSARDQ
jgi:acetoacetyl-CoA synthetase